MRALGQLLLPPLSVLAHRVHDVVLPGGRSLLDVEISGASGLLEIGGIWSWFWGACAHRLIVPVGAPLRVRVWNLYGRSTVWLPMDPSEEHGPVAIAVPIVDRSAFPRLSLAHSSRTGQSGIKPWPLATALLRPARGRSTGPRQQGTNEPPIGHQQGTNEAPMKHQRGDR